FKLRGIMYGGKTSNHFTCRFIDRQGEIWFHDGITTGFTCTPEVKIATVTNLLNLHSCGTKRAVAVVYARVPG
ncbi:hypothetical protein B0H13DRAFT_1618732, partial [Mycena leptocephala]